MMKEHFTYRTGHPLLEELKKYIYAHRGYHDKPQVPENSLAAFRRAAERGWGTEFDVHLLKDGNLVVFHDSDLFRCTGAEGTLEDLTLSEAKELRLEGTQERIPTFDEVLSVCRNTPMIIELKAFGRNHKALAEAVCRRLDSVKTLFCLESFDPRAMAAVRKFRPDFVRGQLASDFTKTPTEELAPWLGKFLSDLRLDFLSRPDFIAYKYEDRMREAVQKTIQRGVQEVSWTIAGKKDLERCLAMGSIPIFERFDPEV